ncbi:hypothetical protein K491DRAFT_780101 [Lophiostoma macrostomum CBS 122681]|uniref:Rhodopsin domain-containing protein n=1 Tax=Lophiostoma macrostomum CBS 122681 TaxID=1314788 RepID=A0A6A6T3J6_9PLEO|nr:hypothetical protein K491DRAFT_780101 [Lophiostoma macrostomum CBS 122681]
MHLPRETSDPPGFIPPPPGVTANVAFALSKFNIATHAICMLLTTAFLAARLYARFFVVGTIAKDDYASIVAWVLSTVYSSLAIASGPLGLGADMWDVPRTKALKLFLYFYVSEVMYGPTVFAAKLAILLLLLRIFGIKRRLRLFITGYIVVLILYYTTSTFVKAFQCKPIASFWIPSLDGHCLENHNIFISDCISAIVTNLIILCTPVPIIWKLNMTMRKKIGSTLAFAAGGLACIASILRLSTVVRTYGNKDVTYNYQFIIIWSSWEISIGVICSCLPVLPSLFKGGRKSPIDDYRSYPRDSDHNKRSAQRFHVTMPLQRLPSTGVIDETRSVSSSQQQLHEEALNRPS